MGIGRGRFHRRSSYGNQLKALPVEAMYAAGVSLGTLVVYAGIIAGSVYLSGETPKWLGGLGSLIFNIGQMKTKTELKYRATCLIISSVVMIVWMATLVVGLVRG